MQRKFDSVEEAFRQQVTNFIVAARATRQATWPEAVVAQGWSVPDWPVHAGGPGWTATQKFIWQQACAAHGIDLQADVGIDIVGPLMLREATQSQQQTYLPGIRDLQVQWCIGYAEHAAGTDLDGLVTTVQRVDDSYRLQGAKTWVTGGIDADWMCCLVRMAPDPREYAVLAVDMHSPGVTARPIKTLDGDTTMAEVSFKDVLVPVGHLLGVPNNGQLYARLFKASEYSTLSKSAVARAQLDVLDDTLKDFDPGDGIHTRRHALAVDLRGLEALELRFLDALAQGAKPPFSLGLLRLKSREILLKLGALQVECFGYYALPYPDELLLHNEGDLGPDGAVAAMRGMLVQQVAAIYEGSAESLKDELARKSLEY